MKYKITNTVSGIELGTYEGRTPEEALDAMAVLSGYRDYSHACEIAASASGEIVVEEVDG